MGLSGEHGQKDRRGARRAPLSAVVKGTTVVRIAVVLEKGRKDPLTAFVFVVCAFAAFEGTDGGLCIVLCVFCELSGYEGI